jgi:hypothetical protein
VDKEREGAVSVQQSALRSRGPKPKSYVYLEGTDAIEIPPVHDSHAARRFVEDGGAAPWRYSIRYEVDIAGEAMVVLP